MIAVLMRKVALGKLRDTLFVLWFVIVALKLITLYAVDVPLNTGALLVPVAAIGRVIGLKTHDWLLARDSLCRRVIGALLLLVSVMELVGLL
jgi:hypothetical protein